MNSLSTRALVAVGAAALALVGTLSIASLLFAVGLVSVAAIVAMALVAFAAQSGRLKDETRLVYRPVYVRRHDLRRQVRSDDD